MPNASRLRPNPNLNPNPNPNPSPNPNQVLKNMLRRALIGLCSSAVSDVVSNSIRVVKTKKQTAKEVAR